MSSTASKACYRKQCFFFLKYNYMYNAFRKLRNSQKVLAKDFSRGLMYEYSIWTEAMASVERGPRSSVILAGKKTTISCNPGPEIIGIDWYFVAVGGTEEIKLSTRSQIFIAAKDVSVSGKIPGESISINSTEFKHAGKYICSTLIRQENRSRADVARFITQVIVLGEFVLTEEIVNFT